MTTITYPSRHARDLHDALHTLSAMGRFRTFIATMAAAGLSTALLKDDVTIFAPSDYAFERLPGDVLRGLLGDRDQLRSVLQMHIIDGAFYERDLIPFTRLPSWAGVDVHLAITDEAETLVNSVPILTADILASNGVVHEVDGVLLGD